MTTINITAAARNRGWALAALHDGGQLQVQLRQGVPHQPDGEAEEDEPAGVSSWLDDNDMAQVMVESEGVSALRAALREVLVSALPGDRQEAGRNY